MSNEHDQVEDWSDIVNVKTMYRYMKCDRNGWRDLYLKEQMLTWKLLVTVFLLAVPALVGIIHWIGWLFS